MEGGRLIEVRLYFDMMFHSLSRCIESGKCFWVYRGAIHSLTCSSLIDGTSVLSKACQLLPEDVVNAFFDSNCQHSAEDLTYDWQMCDCTMYTPGCTLKKVALEWKWFWIAGIHMKWRCDHPSWPAPNMWLFNLHRSVGRALQSKRRTHWSESPWSPG